MATSKSNLLIFGASYGSLFGIKALAAGYDVHLVCKPDEAELFASEGARVRLPVRGLAEEIELDSRELPGQLTAGPPQDADPADFGLVVLAMQEPQFSAPGVRELLARTAQSSRPCLSIMNMPPLPYLQRIVGLETKDFADCYTEAALWEAFDPGRITLCSPDAQAVRPPDAPANFLQVRLPTNFKAAIFENAADTALLEHLAVAIEDYHHPVNDQLTPMPVKLRVHASLFVPLAKWAMLLTGNYRCIGEDSVRPIKDAVLTDLDTSRTIYREVVAICQELGGNHEDFVPFDKYADAASLLANPSSVARAVDQGAPRIERVDKIVQRCATLQNRNTRWIDEIVDRVDRRLEQNQSA